MGNKQLVLNLYGGPGTGKSTGAAYIFSQLKMLGVRAELVTEYAKDLTWEHRNVALSDQIYVFGKQQKRLNVLSGQIDIVVTDSPLLLSLIYAGEAIPDSFYELVKDAYASYDNIEWFLHRDKAYDCVGRNQTEQEAKDIDNEVKGLLEYRGTYKEAPGNILGYNIILQEAIRKVERKIGRCIQQAQ